MNKDRSDNAVGDRVSTKHHQTSSSCMVWAKAFHQEWNFWGAVWKLMRFCVAFSSNDNQVIDLANLLGIIMKMHFLMGE